jgi:hypothetical protein
MEGEILEGEIRQYVNDPELDNPYWAGVSADRVSAISWSLAAQVTLPLHRRPPGSCDDRRTDGLVSRSDDAQLCVVAKAMT